MRGFQRKISTWAARLESAGAEAANASARRGAALAREKAPVISGELRSGISARDLGGGGAAVVSRAGHAPMVEYGTSRMAPRPHMLPMARELRAEFIRECSARLREVFK